MNGAVTNSSPAHPRGRIRRLAVSFAIVPLLAMLPDRAHAQESPYFVTYSHHMEEPGNLELALTPTLGVPREGNRSIATTMELEYGTRAWWSTAVYLDGQKTSRDSTLFTGFHFENRFRLLMQEHRINPVLYVEYVDVNGADKAMREVVGFDSWRDLTVENAEARQEKKRELETKLILSSDNRGWNFAGNLIGEKKLEPGAPWEFGYAAGLSRPLVLAASAGECRLCPENFTAGLELYGGLGEQRQLTLAGTSHYLAPAIAWDLPSGVTLRVSPTFGLTRNSSRSFLRFGVSYEFPAWSWR